MPVRDCAFLFSYITAILALLPFFMAFLKSEWTTYEDGYAGLWSCCTLNESLPHSERLKCWNTAKAEGPVFMEIVRTLIILALLCEVYGLVGYQCFVMKGGETGLERLLKERGMEIGYFIAGCFTITGVVLYGVNNYDYYTNTKHESNVKFRWAFYVMAIAGGWTFFVSILMGFTKVVNEEQDKKTQTVAIGKEPKTNGAKKSENKTDNGNEKESNNDNDIEVKTSALKRIVAPTHVVLAFNRIKSAKQKNRTDENGNTLENLPRLFTPSGKTRPTSASSLSSSSSLEEGKNEKHQRQQVKRSVTTLGDNMNSKPWAVDFIEDDETSAQKNKPRRHTSHDAIGQNNPPPPNRLPPIPDRGIYTIPTAGDNQPGLLTPPKYDEVIGVQEYGDAPMSFQTEQSQVFQPYTKK